MKSILLKSTFFAAALAFSSCHMNFNNGIKGSGNVTTEERQIGEFTGIVVGSGLQLSVEQGNGQSVTVKADDNLQKVITTRVENGILYVEAAEGFDSNSSPNIKVRIPNITSLKATAGSTLSTVGAIKTPTLNVQSDSGSEVSISVEAESLTLETSSGSTIEARGKALRLDTSSSSGSSINAAGLMANEVMAQTSSGSSTDVNAILKLDAKASSGGSIDYIGTPKQLQKEESSGGSVSQN
jgi:hypothetical protein